MKFSQYNELQESQRSILAKKFSVLCNVQKRNVTLLAYNTGLPIFSLSEANRETTDKFVWLFQYGRIFVIRIKWLETDVELQEFVVGYNRGTSKRNTGDLAGQRIRGIFVKGLLVGGYAINTKPPYRYLNDIPEEHREATLKVLKNFPVISEISSLWVKDSASNLVRALIYNLSVLDAARDGPDYILGASYVNAYRAVQMRAIPELLWSGKVSIQGKYRSVHYFYGTPAQCVLRLPYATFYGWIERLRKSWSKNLRSI